MRIFQKLIEEDKYQKKSVGKYKDENRCLVSRGQWPGLAAAFNHTSKLLDSIFQLFNFIFDISIILTDG